MCDGPALGAPCDSDLPSPQLRGLYSVVWHPAVAKAIAAIAMSENTRFFMLHFLNLPEFIRPLYWPTVDFWFHF